MKSQKTYVNEDGTLSLWRFDTDINPNGPVEVIEDYKVGDEMITLKPEKRTKKVVATSKPLPKTKQKYLNPATGKMVGYVRAKNLGLI